MNIRYTITWPDPNDAESPSRFYESLRAGVARNNNLPDGARFPLDCPYEVGLARSLDEQPGWLVAILAVQVAETKDPQGADTLPLLQTWIAQCASSGLPVEANLNAAPARHIKLASELGPGYQVIDNFGTFAGEPAPEDLAQEAPAASPEHATPAAPAAQPQPPAKPVTETTARPMSGAHSQSAAVPVQITTSGLATCLRVGLILAGALLGLAGLVIAAALALAQADSGAASSPVELILPLLCCPLPLLGLSVGLIVFGAILPKLVKPR